MRVLFAGEDQALMRAIVRHMERQHDTLDVVRRLEEAAERLEASQYDAAILDVTQRRATGVQLVRRLREAENAVPILLLNAHPSVGDKVEGLDSGANDYMSKPFEMRELMARLRSITRGRRAASAQVEFGNVTLDRITFELSSPTGSVLLANKEFQIMEYLLLNPERLIPTEQLLERVWGHNKETRVNVVWVYISYLRKKLALLEADVFIAVRRSAGYTLEKRAREGLACEAAQ